MSWNENGPKPEYYASLKDAPEGFYSDPEGNLWARFQNGCLCLEEDGAENLPMGNAAIFRGRPRKMAANPAESGPFRRVRSFSIKDES